MSILAVDQDGKVKGRDRPNSAGLGAWQLSDAWI